MKPIIDKIELFLLCFTVFAIPVHIKITSISIGFLMVIALLKKENYREFAKIYKNKKVLILIFPYFLFILGLINTKHISEGMTQVEIVTSLLLFPIIFTSFKSNKVKYRTEFIQSFFILGVITAYLICLSVAVPAYIGSKDFNVFFYTSFSHVIKGPHHLSYCVIFVIVILMSSLLKKTPLFITKKENTAIKIILCLIAILFLFQLSSKATILLFVSITALVFIYVIAKKIIPLKYSLPAIIVVILISIVAFSNPKINSRFKNLTIAVTHRKDVDLRSHESTAMRIAAFKAGTGIIKENFWTGVGTGDFSYAMNSYYKAHNYQGAYINNISPHNQFIRSFVMQGVFGFLSVVLMFVMMFYIAIKEKHFLLLLWSIIMLVLFNVEDIFGIQDGIVFFCFYTSYLVLCPMDTKINYDAARLESESDISS